MSRIGKKIIDIPEGVEVSVSGATVQAKGPKGTLSIEHLPHVQVVKEDKTLQVKLVREDDKKGPAIWGLTRALIANMIVGVSKGFSKSLEVNGVGYKAVLQGKKLILNVGYSHPVEYDIPDGIEVKVEKNVITISGIDRQLVGQVAAEIRKIRKPEPYKGKGIKYSDEVIRRKVGKVLKSAG